MRYFRLLVLWCAVAGAQLAMAQTPQLAADIHETIVSIPVVINGKPTALRFRSTNVFRKEGAGWRLVHHHADQAAPMAAPSGSPAKP